MPRTAVPVTALVPNAGVATGVGTDVDPANDHVVTPPAKFERVFLRVTNTHAAPHDVTVVAGANPPALSAGQGNVAVTVPATSGDMLIGPLESARFMQADGTLHVDIEADHAGKIWAIGVTVV